MRFRKLVRPLPPEPSLVPDGVDSGPRSADRPDPSPLIPPCVAGVLASSIEVLCAGSSATDDPLHGEVLGSDASGIWWMPSSAYGSPGVDFERRIGYAYAAALDVRGGPDGLAGLRALQAGAAPGIVAAVAPTAERLAARGIPDPPWWRHVGGLRLVRAVELRSEDEGCRSSIVFVEVARGDTTMTLGVLSDAEAAGVAASIGLFEPLDALRDELREAGTGAALDRLLHPLPVARARRRVLRAIERTDLLGMADRYGPGFVAFRGLALRWMEAVGTGEGTGDDGARPGGRKSPRLRRLDR
jgi:hypothetical protein